MNKLFPGVELVICGNVVYFFKILKLYYKLQRLMYSSAN